MPIKFVRADVDIQKKITLTPGSHIIGRGNLFEVFDKRVSRRHAKLEVNNDSLVVNALHTNPVFYTKRGNSKSEALTLNSEVVLCNGDKIGFLPRTYWFEIIVVNNVETTSEKGNNNEDNENEQLPDICEASSLKESSDENTQQVETFPDPNAEQLHTSQNDNTCVSPAKRRRTASEDTLNFDTDGQNDEDKIAKKIKLEPPDINKNVMQGASSSSFHQGCPSTSVRERCYYGERCYRRNPVHLVQYSHPRDSDWGTGDKGQCPNGTNCTKNDPRHWDTHNHPTGTTRLPQLQGKPKPKKKKKQKQDSTDESDQDLDEFNLRACRRNRRDSASDPYGSDIDLDITRSEPDPYGTDESDEWQPPQNG